MADLREQAAERGAAIFGLQGQGGIGKTALAAVFADELKARYPDAQLFVDLRGAYQQQPLTPEQALAQLIQAFHPTARLPAERDALERQYRSTLAGQRALVFLDNARDAEQVKPLLPPKGCFVLVTSRQRLDLAGLYARNLDRLLRPEANDLLHRIAPRIGPFADEMARLCGDLPLALELAGRALSVRDDLTPERYAAKLSDEQGRMKALDQVMASLSLSYDLLDADLQAAWRALAVFVGDFQLISAAAVLGVDADAASDVLGGLLRYSMVEYDQDTGRYRLHDLARDAAGARLAGDERLGAERRHAAHFMQVLSAADDLYLEGGDKVLAGLALFDQERANIEAGQAWAAARAGQDDEAARLCDDYPNAGAYVLDLRQHPRTRIAWMEAALAAARRLKNRTREGIHLGNLGLAYADLGEPRRAIEFYEQDLAIAREIGDRRGEGAALGNLGNAYAALGEPRRAIEFYEQRLVIAREVGDRRGEGTALGNLGNAYHSLGEPHRAIEFHEQRLIIAREIGDRRGEGNALGNLGNAYYSLDEPRRAIEFHERDLVIRREIGDRRGEGNALWNMSLALDELGKRADAIANAEAALRLFEQIEDPNAEKVRRKLAEWQRIL